MTRIVDQAMDPRFPLSLRMRPEMPGDAEALQAELEPDLMASMTDVDGDIEVLLQTPEQLASLLLTLDRGMDMHRMVQTMDLSEAFTGDWLDDSPARARRVLSALGDGFPEARRAYLSTFIPEEVNDIEPN